MAIYGTFIGPDGTTISYRHDSDICACSECETARWERIERENTKNDLFKQDDFNQQYALAKEQGDKRFGSPCEHARTKNGYCLNCLRKVVE